MDHKRSAIIVKSGYLFILTNFLLAAFNLVVGLLSGSLAITSDAAHSLIDAASGFVLRFEIGCQFSEQFFVRSRHVGKGV